MKRFALIAALLFLILFPSCGKKSPTQPDDNDPIVSISGKVDTPKSEITSELTISTSQGTASVDTNGNFSAHVHTSEHNEVIIATLEEKPVLLGYALPGDKTLNINYESTALTLVMMNPLLIGSSVEFRAEFVEKVKTHSSFSTLVTAIEAAYTENPATTLDMGKNQEIYEKAVLLFMDIYNQYNDNASAQKTAILSEPYIEDRNGNNIAYINPSYVYYGSNTRNINNNESFSILLKNRSFINVCIWPPKIFGEPQEEIKTLNDGVYKIEFYKGFIVPEGKSVLDLVNVTDPFGQATLSNLYQGFMNILDIIAPVPQTDAKSVIEKFNISRIDIIQLVEAIRDGSVNDVVRVAISLLSKNIDNISFAIFQSLPNPASFAEFTYKLGPVLENVAFVLKVVNAVDKVPFFIDLIGCESYKCFDIQQIDGVVSEPVESVIYTISGRVLESGFGLSGVSVHLTGAGKDMTVTTGSTGSYTFTGLLNGTYTLTPSKTDYTFSPANPIVTVNNANASVPDIAATKQTTPHDIEGITFVSIPGGTFKMGTTLGLEDEQPIHEVTLDSFEISETEITYEQYVDYLNKAYQSSAGEHQICLVYKSASDYYVGPHPWDIGDILYIHLSGSWGTNPENKCFININEKNEFSVVPGKEKRPVTFISWYGAKAYARFYGWDLSTEAEWEYAAKGLEDYIYATDDNTISIIKANYNNNIGHPVDVGSYYPNIWGLYDMSGNVEEWCNDRYQNDYYLNSENKNPIGPLSGTEYVLRGGECFNGGNYCRVTRRFHSKRNTIGPGRGFRVVRRPGGITY